VSRERPTRPSDAHSAEHYPYSEQRFESDQELTQERFTPPCLP
jgi:hypothetical protein